MSEIPTHPEVPEPGLTVRETALASDMLLGIGSTALQSIDTDSHRHYGIAWMSQREFSGLVGEFADNPRQALAAARGTLNRIATDESLDPAHRDVRLQYYLDAYTSLSVKIDHAAFAGGGRHRVDSGVPSYIPDGFVDLGSQRTVDTAERYRETIYVDKPGMYRRHRQTLFDIFGARYDGQDQAETETSIADLLAKKVFDELPYDHSEPTFNGERVNLADLDEGVCRHQALTFQVLAQAVGLNSKLVKGDVLAEGQRYRHAVNFVEIGGNWDLYDVTNPEHIGTPRGYQWQPTVVAVDRPPSPGESRRYSSRSFYGGQPYEFQNDDNMYWFVRPESDPRANFGKTN